MIVDDLKNSILLSAFQGKISERNAKDTNIKETLLLIKEEKEEFILSNKNIKKIKLEEILEKEKPFEIPKEWLWVRWGSLSNSIQYGVNNGALQNGNVKLVRISDIQNNEIDWNNVPYSLIKEKEIKQYLLKENDILFARTGGTVGKSVIVKNIPKDIPYVFAGYLIRSNYSQKVNYKYLKYFMESSLYWNQLKNGTIGSAQPNCNGQTLSKMIIPLPPIEEQQRIVDKIEKLFNKLDETKILEEELIQLKNKFPKNLKDAILNEILSKYTNTTLLDNISTINGGYAFKSSEYVNEGIRVIRISDFDEYGIKSNNIVNYKYDKSLEQYKIDNDDIIICMTGGTVGKNLLLKNIPNNYYTNQRVATIKIIKDFIPEFIYYCINAPYIQNLIQNSKNSTNDNISMSLIKSFPIPNISIEEQQIVVKKIEGLLSFCEEIYYIVN